VGVQTPRHSPTFALVNELPQCAGPLLHMDMYRLSKKSGGLSRWKITGPRTVCLIEWADASERWPSCALRFASTTPTETRRIRIRADQSLQNDYVSFDLIRRRTTLNPFDRSEYEPSGFLAIETSPLFSLAVGTETHVIKDYQGPLQWRHAENLFAG